MTTIGGKCQLPLLGHLESDQAKTAKAKRCLGLIDSQLQIPKLLSLGSIAAVLEQSEHKTASGRSNFVCRLGNGPPGAQACPFLDSLSPPLDAPYPFLSGFLNGSPQSQCSCQWRHEEIWPAERPEGEPGHDAPRRWDENRHPTSCAAAQSHNR